jgi:flagellar biogenesis protein FliO
MQMARMPLIIRIAGLAVVLGSTLHATGATGQIPPRPFEPSQRHAAQPHPWNGGNSSPSAPGRLLPTAYQTPVQNAAAPAPLQQPLPLTPPQNGAGPAGGNPNIKPLATGAASLGLVLGLFLLVIWSVRRGMPKGAGMLPAEAVEVLGRAPIAGRQHVHLVRCGNKLVLLSAHGAGVETLTEISDPAEVERLQEICRHTTTPAGALKQLLGRIAAPSLPAVRMETADNLDFDHLHSTGFRRA